MASKGYEIDESRWFEEVKKLVSLSEICVNVKWSFGHMTATGFLYRVDGRRIDIVPSQGSRRGQKTLLITARIPSLDVDFVRKIDEKNHVFLAAYHAGEHFCLADSWEALTFADSEARVQ